MQFIVRSLTFTMSMGENTSASTHAYTWLFSKSNKRRTFFSTYDFNKQKQNKKTSFTKWLFSMKSGKCLRNGEKNPQEFYDNLLAALLSTCLWSVIRQLSRIFRARWRFTFALPPTHTNAHEERDGGTPIELPVATMPSNLTSICLSSAFFGNYVFYWNIYIWLLTVIPLYLLPSLLAMIRPSFIHLYIITRLLSIYSFRWSRQHLFFTGKFGKHQKQEKGRAESRVTSIDIEIHFEGFIRTSI